MNRERIHETILELAAEHHTATYALEAAMQKMHLNQLVELFDQVADHHDLTHPKRSSSR